MEKPSLAIWSGTELRFLGHTFFQHTMVCIQLEEVLFQDTNDDYLCKTAVTAEDARTLIEASFE